MSYYHYHHYHHSLLTSSECGCGGVPGGEGVFDVVGGGVDEHPALVPGAALHADVLVDVAQALQLAVADHDGCTADREESERE